MNEKEIERLTRIAEYTAAILADAELRTNGPDEALHAIRLATALLERRCVQRFGREWVDQVNAAIEVPTGEAADNIMRGLVPQ